jgi:hypothetical protein
MACHGFHSGFHDQSIVLERTNESGSKN